MHLKPRRVALILLPIALLLTTLSCNKDNKKNVDDLHILNEYKGPIEALQKLSSDLKAYEKSVHFVDSLPQSSSIDWNAVRYVRSFADSVGMYVLPLNTGGNETEILLTATVSGDQRLQYATVVNKSSVRKKSGSSLYDFKQLQLFTQPEKLKSPVSPSIQADSRSTILDKSSTAINTTAAQEECFIIVNAFVTVEISQCNQSVNTVVDYAINYIVQQLTYTLNNDFNGGFYVELQAGAGMRIKGPKVLIPMLIHELQNRMSAILNEFAMNSWNIVGCGVSYAYLNNYAIAYNNCNGNPPGGGEGEGGGQWGYEPGEADAPLGTDCNSFSFFKTTPANWQESGLNNIRLKWVWSGGGGVGLTRTVYVNHIVYGLPITYGNGKTLSPGAAATIAARATQIAKFDTYLEFDKSPTNPDDATVIAFYKQRLQLAMVASGGTAGVTGTGSSTILFNDEERSFFADPYDCY